MLETKKEKITPKKAYTRDTRRLHMGQYYSDGGNVYKNSTIEDNYSEVGDYTEINDKFSKAQNKLENLGVRLSSIGEAPHYVALYDNKNSYLRACFDMKRIVSLILALIMLVCLPAFVVSCADKNEQGTVTDANGCTVITMRVSHPRSLSLHVIIGS